jgi:diguanylate cyclase (GGDEF)-like protein/putative nucleotidyltransferase with HDIG domain
VNFYHAGKLLIRSILLLIKPVHIVNKNHDKLKYIYWAFSVTYLIGLALVSPNNSYKMLSGLMYIFLLLAFHYNSKNISYLFATSALLIQHIVLLGIEKYHLIGAGALTPFIIHSVFLYVPVLPNPFYSLVGIITLTYHYWLYPTFNPGLTIMKNINTIILCLLAATVLRFWRNLLAERNRFYQASITDSLIGIYTFTHIIKIGQDLLNKGTKLIAIIIDLDDFKKINDTYGHFAGNRVLIQFTKILSNFAGPNAIISRLGGDEFCILLESSKADFESVVRRLDQLTCSVMADKELGPIIIGFSYGIAAATDSDKQINIENLLDLADKNMYQNKLLNKSNYKSFEIDFAIPAPTLELLNILSQKDMYTFVHSINVARLSAKLAEKAGMDSKTVNEIRLAGILHDVGKIVITNEILKKPGKLNSNEYTSIKKHVTRGLNLLQEFNLSNKILRAIAEHHERIDGTGYPYGLTGDKISLLGRILAITDAYSAMTIKRVYRCKLSPANALKELVAGKGSQFDPVLVEEFSKILTSEIEITVES